MRSAALGQPLILTPGKQPKYSNLGYWFLGQLVAEVSNAPGRDNDEKYVNYVTENILKPLGMNQSGFLLPKDKSDALAKAHGLWDEGKRVPLPSVYDAGGSASAWGLYSTVEDMTQIAHWLYRGFSGLPGVLKPETIAMMAGDKWGYGLGLLNIVFAKNQNVIGHGGRFPGYVSAIWYDTLTQVGAAIALNSVESSDIFWSYYMQIKATIERAIANAPPTSLSGRKPSPAISDKILFEDLPFQGDLSLPPGAEEYKGILGLYRNLFRRIWIWPNHNKSSQSPLVLFEGRGSRGWTSTEIVPVKKSAQALEFIINAGTDFAGWTGEKLVVNLVNGKPDHMMIANSTRFTFTAPPPL